MLRVPLFSYLSNMSAATRTLEGGILGIIAGGIAAVFTLPQAAALIGWDIAALFFITTIWLVAWRLDAEDTERRATRLDPNRVLADSLVGSAAIAILAAVALALARAGNAHGATKGYLLAVGIVSVALGWLTVQTLFTLLYARLYYGGERGGVNFNEADLPTYIDFAYLAFTVGMTFQVSDTNLTSKPVRRAALQQALISYLFGAVILALVVNIVATLL